MTAPELHVVEAGEGHPVVLLHGLTATHHYVVMGSRTLERSGHRVIAYDARGHGASAPAASYGYPELADDLERVLDELGVERAVLAGASMGAHTLLRFALAHPERVAACVVITPAWEPGRGEDVERWSALAAALRAGGIDGFLEAYGTGGVPERWVDTIRTVVRQRLERHQDLGAVADALEQVPRSAPLDALEDLRGVRAPTIVVADRDEADPGHPLAVGERYAALIPGARLVVEEEGASPIAWQGGRLSRLIAELAAEAAR